MAGKEYVRLVDDAEVAVLMIHGIVGTPEHFRPFLSLIPEHWSVVNLLLDGHGKGVKEFGASSMDKWKRQVFDRLEELLAKHERVLIVAHSMGTLFAIQAAVEYGDRIAGLFLLNVPMRVHLPPATILAALKIAFGLAKEGDGTAWAMKEDCSVQLTGPVWQYIRWLPRLLELLREIRETRPLLPKLNIPVRAFHSGKDELVSNRSCEDLQEIPGAPVVLLPNSGHFGYDEGELCLLQGELAKMMRKLQ